MLNRRLNLSEISDHFQENGFFLNQNTFSTANIVAIQNELLAMGNLIDPNLKFTHINDLWLFYKQKNRRLASAIYNGFKYLHTINKLVVSEEMQLALNKICGITHPALIDINCRIDSYNESKFLFDWHQDYWFSIASTNAVVVWIPLNELSPDTGGLELISNVHTQGKIFNTKAGKTYHSYADAVLLDDTIPLEQSEKIQAIPLGGALFFKFNTLHKSLPVVDTKKARFTIQLRFADYADHEFLKNYFKPGVVTHTKVDYLERNSK